MTVPYDEVVCMLCGKKMKSVEWSHLWHIHGITIEEYEKMFPNSPRVSINTLRKLGRHDEAKLMELRWLAGELDYEFKKAEDKRNR